MRILTTIFLTSIFELSFGQSFTYPTIKQNGRDINDFTPSGWIILKSASGDLNTDKLDDIAFVLQHKDSMTFIRHEPEFKTDYNDTLVYQPRILIIAFYNAITKQYDNVQQSDSFILCHDNPNMEEPFEGITISKGVLTINFSIFMNMGGWSMSNHNYKFRFQDNEFKLIGADYNSTHRASGETEYRSYNFLTKKVKIDTGNISSDKQKTIWRTFEFKELKTFRTFTQPFTWELEEDFYI